MSGVGERNESTRIAWLERTLGQIPARARILDAGAGEQQFKRFCAHLDHVAQDFAQYDGVGDGAGLQMGTWDQTRLDIVSDITAIPEPDSSFDAIMCTEVFEHIQRPVLAVKEFSRLLRKGGQLIITAPFCSLTHFALYHFYSGFNRYFYETHLPAHSLRIVEMEANGQQTILSSPQLDPGIQKSGTVTRGARNTVSYRISTYGINRPSGLNMTEEKVARVCHVLRKILDL